MCPGVWIASHSRPGELERLAVHRPGGSGCGGANSQRSARIMMRVFERRHRVLAPAPRRLATPRAPSSPAARSSGRRGAGRRRTHRRGRAMVGISSRRCRAASRPAVGRDALEPRAALLLGRACVAPVGLRSIDHVVNAWCVISSASASLLDPAGAAEVVGMRVRDDDGVDVADLEAGGLQALLQRLPRAGPGDRGRRRRGRGRRAGRTCSRARARASRSAAACG